RTHRAARASVLRRRIAVAAVGGFQPHRGPRAPGARHAAARAAAWRQCTVKSGSPWVAPQLDLKVGGAPLSDGLAQRLTGLRVHQHLSQRASCEIALAGIEGELARSGFEAGAQIRIAMKQGKILFEGRISAVELSYGPDRIVAVAVRAYDSLVALRNRQ